VWRPASGFQELIYPLSCSFFGLQMGELQVWPIIHTSERYRQDELVQLPASETGPVCLDSDMRCG